MQEKDSYIMKLEQEIGQMRTQDLVTIGASDTRFATDHRSLYGGPSNGYNVFTKCKTQSRI